MKTPVSRVGNKSSVLHILYAVFPAKYGRFIDVFGGSGSVLLGKPEVHPFEVYNDFDHNLVNLFRCMKDRTMATIRELGFCNLNSREDFNAIKKFFAHEEFDDKYLSEELELTKIMLPPPEAKELAEIKYMAMKNTQKKKKGGSVQELIGIRTFTDYGIVTERGELLFYLVTPTNISVLSAASIENKIRNLLLVLSAQPELEITVTDSSECFNENKLYLSKQVEKEKSPRVKALLEQDIRFLDAVQLEMATARQFLFTARCHNLNPQQVFKRANEIEKTISEHGFEVHRMKKSEIKRFLALYFDASMQGEQMPDVDGEQFVERSDV